MTDRTTIHNLACPYCRAPLLTPKGVHPFVQKGGVWVAVYSTQGGSNDVHVTLSVEDPNKLADRFIYSRFVHTCGELQTS